MTHDRLLPFLTADLPGVGGVIKQHDEDFVVEEIPLYPAGGEGTHTYFTIEKRGLTTLAAIQLIARALGKTGWDIGYAGLKDAHGITRQRLSVEHLDPEQVRALSLPRITVLAVDRHNNKIKLGHLAGNRFVIKIRDTVRSPLDQARPILKALTARGVPNYFGPQRFGARGDNAAVGVAVLRDDYEEAIRRILGRPGPFDHGDIRRARELFDTGDYQAAADAWPQAMRMQVRVCRQMGKSSADPRKAWRTVDHTLRKLYLSAVQSDLFNRVLIRRMDGIDRLMNGDFAWKHANGACFRVEDAAIEQIRCDRLEISPTGPLFGKRMTDPSGEPANIEREVLQESGIRREQLRPRDGTRMDGARRPLRVPLLDPQIDAGDDARGPFLGLRFTLPPGAYATSVTREICKHRAQVPVE